VVYEKDENYLKKKRKLLQNEEHLVANKTDIIQRVLK